MASRLDQEIEHLGILVEKRLALCNATLQEVNCTLATNLAPAESHTFLADNLDPGRPSSSHLLQPSASICGPQTASRTNAKRASVAESS